MRVKGLTSGEHTVEGNHFRRRFVAGNFHEGWEDYRATVSVDGDGSVTLLTLELTARAK